MQTNMVDAMARSNNPVRAARAIREQVEARVVGAREELELQWQNERKRLLDEIERLKTGVSADEKKKAARQALLQKLGKVQGSTPVAAKTADEWANEFQSTKAQWDVEREQLQADVQRLGFELQQARELISREGVQEIRTEYEHKLAEANSERHRLEQDIQFVTSELASERQRLSARIGALEEALPQAQEVTRKQTLAELQNQLDDKNRRSQPRSLSHGAQLSGNGWKLGRRAPPHQKTNGDPRRATARSARDGLQGAEEFRSVYRVLKT